MRLRLHERAVCHRVTLPPLRRELGEKEEEQSAHRVVQLEGEDICAVSLSKLISWAPRAVMHRSGTKDAS
jgi:hypothetical protein